MAENCTVYFPLSNFIIFFGGNFFFLIFVQVSLEAHFSNDLGLDSLDAVEVVMAIEEEFSVEIPDKDADEIKSAAQAVEYISKRDDAH